VNKFRDDPQGVGSGDSALLNRLDGGHPWMDPFMLLPRVP
jgi:hypothetical protein